MFKKKEEAVDYSIENISQDTKLNTTSILKLEEFQRQIKRDLYVENCFRVDFKNENQYILKSEAVSFEKLTVDYLHTSTRKFYCTPEAYKYKEEFIKECEKEVKEFKKNNKQTTWNPKNLKKK